MCNQGTHLQKHALEKYTLMMMMTTKEEYLAAALSSAHHHHYHHHHHVHGRVQVAEKLAGTGAFTPQATITAQTVHSFHSLYFNSVYLLFFNLAQPTITAPNCTLVSLALL